MKLKIVIGLITLASLNAFANGSLPASANELVGSTYSCNDGLVQFNQKSKSTTIAVPGTNQQLTIMPTLSSIYVLVQSVEGSVYKNLNGSMDPFVASEAQTKVSAISLTEFMPETSMIRVKIPTGHGWAGIECFKL